MHLAPSLPATRHYLRGGRCRLSAFFMQRGTVRLIRVRLSACAVPPKRMARYISKDTAHIDSVQYQFGLKFR